MLQVLKCQFSYRRIRYRGMALEQRPDFHALYTRHSAPVTVRARLP